MKLSSNCRLQFHGGSQVDFLRRARFVDTKPDFCVPPLLPFIFITGRCTYYCLFASMLPSPHIDVEWKLRMFPRVRGKRDSSSSRLFDFYTRKILSLTDKRFFFFF